MSKRARPRQERGAFTSFAKESPGDVETLGFYTLMVSVLLTKLTRLKTSKKIVSRHGVQNQKEPSSVVVEA